MSISLARHVVSKRRDPQSGQLPLVRLDVLLRASSWADLALAALGRASSDHAVADIASVERRPTGVRFNLKSANRPALLFQMHRDALLAALRPYPIELRA